jgi:hypothetical protein
MIFFASSSAQRLKPRAIDIRVNIDPVHWFLGPPREPGSSLYLEDAATEFQVQGLELGWTIVTWADGHGCGGGVTTFPQNPFRVAFVDKGERHPFTGVAYVGSANRHGPSFSGNCEAMSKAPTSTENQYASPSAERISQVRHFVSGMIG